MELCRRDQLGVFVDGVLLVHRLTGTSAVARAQATNLQYLEMLQPDRLVWSFRKQAGLPAVGEPYR